MGLFNKMKPQKDTDIAHKFTKIIDNKNVVVHCDMSLSAQAEAIFNLIENTQKAKNVLQDGYKIQIGWSMYFITKQKNEFVLSVPNYLKNPFKDTTTDVTVALSVQMEQNSFLAQTNIEGEQVSFQDKVVILKDALNSDELYFERQEIRQNDSGWYLGLLKDPKEATRNVEDYISVYSYQLLEMKPQLIKLLSLPVGCLVIIKNNEVIEIVDSENKRIL